jgi:tyrosine decarboxylase/aspartate 1-decarboxylase
MNIPYFREPNMNIVTIKSSFIPEKLAHQFDLVPQKHNTENEWYKIVVMEHVEVDHLSKFLEKLKKSMVIHS